MESFYLINDTINNIFHNEYNSLSYLCYLDEILYGNYDIWKKSRKRYKIYHKITLRLVNVFILPIKMKVIIEKINDFIKFRIINIINRKSFKYEKLDCYMVIINE